MWSKQESGVRSKRNSWREKGGKITPYSPSPHLSISPLNFIDPVRGSIKVAILMLTTTLDSMY